MDEPIKTLANCNDEDFLRQTNKIRRAVEKWLTITEIKKIRERMPKIKPIPEGLDKKQAELIEKENERHKTQQMKKNLDDILDAVLEEHPKETLEIIKLCCFVDPSDETHKITYYMAAFAEMFANEDVLNFFTSLMNLGKKFGLTL